MSTSRIEDPSTAVSPAAPYNFLKRALDLSVCVLAAPILLPMGLLIAAAVRWESPGPVFSVQRRAGKAGRIFNLIKFRIAAPSDGGGDASQITAVGSLLRSTNLVELPQLLNVFQGDMSLVGPRPDLTHDAELYSHWHFARLAALPGITGLAQVRRHQILSFDDIVKHDLQYITTRCLKLDLKILWWTLRDALQQGSTE